MTNSNRPKWLDVAKLKKFAGKEAEQQSTLNINLPVHSRKVIATYICPQCRLQYTSSDVEMQVKKAARTGVQYIKCPKCSSPLREGSTAVVKDLTNIVNRADKYQDSNRPPTSRSIDTWVDKAIYGKIVQSLGTHIQQFGIDNPQLKFQRGIRAQKFPGQPKTAKGAEFTVEFTDFNNTRNRIIIQAGITTNGDLIVPRTFKTLSGGEYPLTKQAIDDLTSGKTYDPVMSDATMRPLTYRYRDPLRFREISADNKKMKKTAMDDPVAMDAEIQDMGVTDPNDIQIMKGVLTKYQATPAGSTPIGQPPTAVDSTPGGGGAFMNGVGLSSKLNMQKKAEFPINEGMQESDPEDNSWEQIGIEALYNAVMEGLSFPEAYDAVRNATQGNALITQAEYDQMGQLITGTLLGDNDQDAIANKAAELVKQAEIDTVKHLHKTAEMVQDEFAFDDMNSDETTQWVDTYVNTYNKSLDNGDGLVEASHAAHKTAANILAEARIKLALRDKDTLVPQVDADPDWSIATTDEFEAEFGGKYEDTDGGILPAEDRGYTTMFKGSSIKTATIHHEDGKWVVKSEDSSKTLGTHDTKEEANKQLQAIHIQQHAAIKKEAAYELTVDGQNILAQLAEGQQIAGPNSEVLRTVLQWIFNNPAASLDEMVSSYSGDIDMLRQAVQYALTMEYIDISSGEQSLPPFGEDNSLEENPPEGYNWGPEELPSGITNASKLNMQKNAESTGVDIDDDDVGQNPINYSRLKGQVQDYLRAGNIPPSKVDMHKLKDGGYSLEELRGLIDSFKVDRDAFFPAAHAAVDPDQLQKSAEEKLSDLFKQMPLEKDDSELPLRRTETCPNKDGEGNIPPRQWKNRRTDNE